MVPLAKILRRRGDAHRAEFAARMSRDHLRAMRAIGRCRTEALGGSLWACPHCGRTRYSYHSCRNRHCPSCGHEEAEAWRERQERLLVPAAYHLVTCTVPEPLRAVIRLHPRECLPLLMRASASALLKFAADPRHVGGMPGVTRTAAPRRRGRSVSQPHLDSANTPFACRSAPVVLAFPQALCQSLHHESSASDRPRRARARMSDDHV